MVETVQMVQPVPRDPRAKPDLLAHKDPKVKKGIKATRATLARKEKQDHRVPQGQMVQPDHKARKGNKVHRVNVVYRVNKAHKVKLDPLVQPDRPDRRAPRVKKVKRATRVTLATLVKQVHGGNKDYRVNRVHRDLLGHRAHKGQSDRPERITRAIISQ